MEYTRQDVFRDNISGKTFVYYGDHNNSILYNSKACGFFRSASQVEYLGRCPMLVLAENAELDKSYYTGGTIGGNKKARLVSIQNDRILPYMMINDSDDSNEPFSNRLLSHIPFDEIIHNLVSREEMENQNKTKHIPFDTLQNYAATQIKTKFVTIDDSKLYKKEEVSFEIPKLSKSLL